ncbi:MAG: hypothetical protein KF745_00320 [Phycisphaeraceae bacterium]|nr:hypothetical protein [Phycisphaeraceae bacterium]
MSHNLTGTVRPESKAQSLCPVRPVANAEPYVWLVLVGALDVILTWIVLFFGGSEVNPIAERALAVAGHWGLIGLKFTVVCVVVLICEYIAMHRPALSRRVAVVGVAISSIPIVMALAQLTAHMAGL